MSLSFKEQNQLNAKQKKLITQTGKQEKVSWCISGLWYNQLASKKHCMNEQPTHLLCRRYCNQQKSSCQHRENTSRDQCTSFD